MSRAREMTRAIPASAEGRETRRPGMRGAALVIALLVMAALLLLGTTFLTISSTETEIARNAREAIQAFYGAEAGLAVLKRDLLAQFGTPGTVIYDVLQNPSVCPPEPLWRALPGGSVGNVKYEVTVRRAPPCSTDPPWCRLCLDARVTARGSAGTGASRQIEVRLQVDTWDFSPAGHALFVDGGVWRWGGVGNMTFAGPVFAKGWSPTYPAMQFGSGGATDTIVNSYKNLDPALQAAIPAPPTKPNPVTGESEITLDTTLRVYQGPVEIQSNSSSVGERAVLGNGVKESLAGVYTNQGFTGSPGADQVYSDNGAGTRFDVPRDILTYPELTGPYSGPPLAGGANPASHDAYLRTNALGIDGSLIIDSTTAPITNTDGTNSLIYEPAVGERPPTLQVNGIVWVKGDIILGGYGGTRLPTIQYKGAGTLYARSDTSDWSWGSIQLTSDLLPSPYKDANDTVPGAQFPTDHRLGLISSGWVTVGDWSTVGASVPPVKIAASIYATYTMYNYAPYQIAGSVMTRYFYVWQTVGIYYVPSLAGAGPPGMPGMAPAKATSPAFVRTLYWRDVMP